MVKGLQRNVENSFDLRRCPRRWDTIFLWQLLSILQCTWWLVCGPKPTRLYIKHFYFDTGDGNHIYLINSEYGMNNRPGTTKLHRPFDLDWGLVLQHSYYTCWQVSCLEMSNQLNQKGKITIFYWKKKLCVNLRTILSHIVLNSSAKNVFVPHCRMLNDSYTVSDHLNVCQFEIVDIFHLPSWQ